MYEEERTRKALIAVVFMVAFTSNIIWAALTSILLALSVLIGVFFGGHAQFKSGPPWDESAQINYPQVISESNSHRYQTVTQLTSGFLGNPF